MVDKVTPEKRSQLNRREYIRRKAYLFHLLGNKCNQCSKTEDLQIDHINPNDKSFNILGNWTKNKKYILLELEKCQLLCKKCHLEKSTEDGTWKGSNNGKAKLKENDVFQIRNLLNQGHSHRHIANRFNVSKTLISLINTGKRWGWLENS